MKFTYEKNFDIAESSIWLMERKMTDRIESVHSGDNFYHCLSYDLKQIRFFFVSTITRDFIDIQFSEFNQQTNFSSRASWINSTVEIE